MHSKMLRKFIGNLKLIFHQKEYFKTINNKSIIIFRQNIEFLMKNTNKIIQKHIFGVLTKTTFRR